jgi:hypothetical protein
MQKLLLVQAIFTYQQGGIENDCSNGNLKMEKLRQWSIANRQFSSFCTCKSISQRRLLIMIVN